MPSQDGRLCLVELIFIIAVFICQQFEDLFLRLQPYAEHALQLVLHLLEHVNPTIQEIHLSRSRMVPQQCTDTDVTTPLLARLMWQEYHDLLRETHLQMQSPRILMQNQQGSQRPRQNLVSSQETATQTSPDQFGTVAESPAEVTCPKAVTSGTAPAEDSPAPAVASPNAVSSQTAAAPTAAAEAAATMAAGIPEVPRDQASSTMTQGDSGYSSGGMQDGAVSRDMKNAVPKNGSDRNHASSGDGTPNHNSDDEGRDDEEHG